MKTINETIEYYNSNAETFISGTVNADMSYVMNKFTSYLKEGAAVLDAGCGSGRDTLDFKNRGYSVDAFDASSVLAEKASEYTGIPVKCCTFEELDVINMYDGIWACASLLHVERAHLKESTRHLVDALKTDGVLYVSFKKGDTERNKDGRFFCDMNESDVQELLESLGVEVLESFITGDVRQDRATELWVNVIGRKQRSK